MKFHVAFFIFCVWAGGQARLGFAQDLIAEPFVGANPFPSAELYSIVQGRQGTKWIASDVGLLKIVGNHITHFTTKNGLEENVILRIYPSPTGKLWVVGMNGTLMYIQHDSLQKLPYSHILRKTPLHIVQFATFQHDSILFIKQNIPSLHSANAQKIHIHQAQEDSTMIINILPDNKTFIQVPKNRLNFAPYWAIQKGAKRYDLGKIVKNNLVQEAKAYILNPSLMYIGVGNELLKLENFNITARYTLPHKIIFIKELHKKVYLSVLHHGIFELQEGAPKKISISNLDNQTVADIMQDEENNLWIATLEKGLFVARIPQAKQLYKGEHTVLNLKENVAIISNNTILYTETPTRINFSSKSAILNSVATIAGEKLYITSEGLQFEKSNELKKYSQYTKDYMPINDKEILIFGGYGIGYLYENKYNNFVLKFRVFCVEKYSQHIALLGTQQDGIKKLDMRHRKVDTSHFAGDFRVNCLKTISPNMIAVGTNDFGVLLMDSVGKTLQTIPQLPQRIDCLAYQDSTLYIGTRLGLYMYYLPTQKVQELNRSNFLPFDEIVKLQIVGKELYIAGKYEIIYLPIQDLRNLPVQIELRYQKLLVGKTLKLDLIQTSYKASQNAVFHIEILNQHNGNIKRYATRQTHIETDLAYGNFTIKLYAHDSLTNSTSPLYTFTLSLPAPYYETNLFWIICALLFVALVLWVAFRIVRQVKKQELQKRLIQQKIMDLESSALQAQMNPHFIFNAINSIQAFILKNKTEEAYFYLGEFAKLFRLILNHSQQKEVLLEEEITLLRLYIALEAQRLKDTIDFQMEIAEDVEIDNTLIPTMLLQPIVENAVWHGLKPDIRPKIIHLRVSRQDAYLHLHLYNNGKPIEKTALPTLHESRGLSIVRERIKILYEKTPLFPTFSLENAPDVGVIAKIVLPLKVVF